ncbi:hypothetical protein HY642_05515 [Candidatus Woesearchaeota archaeon]|nr:hypothetical protein [Candidatus Woesearchaeota archaeon]
MQIKITPDKEKAKALIAMASITLERLNETSKEKYPTNTLTDYYDVMHKLMEAIAYTQGVKIKGEGAHQELIDYVCRKFELEEGIRHFIQELRGYRNQISYEGFMITPAFIMTNQSKIEQVISRLIGLAEHLMI